MPNANNSSPRLSTTMDEAKSLPSLRYQDRKPKWWRDISRRKPSKAQRRCRQEMEQYVITLPPYGELLDCKKVFNNDFPVNLEIGFGNGHNLLCLAGKDIYQNWIGSEVHVSAPCKVLQKMQFAQQKHQNWTGFTAYKESNGDCDDSVIMADDDNWVPWDDQNEPSLIPYGNVRMFTGDGYKLVARALKPCSLASILVTFPDPFPNEQDIPCRLIQEDSLRHFHRVLQANGRVFLATDDDNYFQWSLKIFASQVQIFARVEPCLNRSSWLPVVSFYERKGWLEGRTTKLACWRKI